MDSKIIFSNSGAKLKKYINNINSHNISSNFDRQNYKIFFINKFNFFIHLLKDKQVKKCLLISMAILAIKVAFSYKFLSSNFIYINLFTKNINLSSILSSNIIYVKVLYLILYAIFIFDITFSVKKIIYKIKNSTNKTINNVEKGDISIGKDKLNNEVIIDNNGLYQNILITGSIGSGKTTGAIDAILEQFISNNLNGVVIDIKGNYVKTINKIANTYFRKKDIIEISFNNDLVYNPLDTNISDIELAHMLKKVIILISENNVEDSFWLDKVESYLRDFIILIRTYNSYVDFGEIHKLVNDKKYLINKINYIKEKVLKNSFDDNTLFKLKNSIKNIKNEYLKLDIRTFNIIKAEITRLTSVFVSDYNIYKKFCGKSNINDFFSGKIIVLSLGIGNNRLLTKVISTYLKLEYQRQVLIREKYKTSFFICDEYQEIANVEDAYFFSISREYKSINVVSMQSYTSLINTLKSTSAAKVIIQNLVNNIWLRNDDNYTISEIIKQIGKEMKSYENLTISETGTNTRYSVLSNSFRDYKTGLSKNISYNKRLDYKYTEDFFVLNLKTFEACCLVSYKNKIYFYEKVFLKGGIKFEKNTK